VTRIAFHTATVPYKTLSPDNDTVQAGRYVATTLRAVDSDLDAANIADSIEIFGITGTFTGGALQEDTRAEATSLINTDTTLAAAQSTTWVDMNGGEVDLVTVTPTFAADSFAFIAGCCNALVQDVLLKFRLYVDGVQRDEYTFAAINISENAVQTHFQALVGAIVCKVTAHNYNVTTNRVLRGFGYPNAKKCGFMIAVGSVELA